MAKMKSFKYNKNKNNYKNKYFNWNKTSYSNFNNESYYNNSNNYNNYNYNDSNNNKYYNSNNNYYNANNNYYNANNNYYNAYNNYYNSNKNHYDSNNNYYSSNNSQYDNSYYYQNYNYSKKYNKNYNNNQSNNYKYNINKEISQIDNNSNDNNIINDHNSKDKTKNNNKVNEQNKMNNENNINNKNNKNKKKSKKMKKFRNKKKSDENKQLDSFKVLYNKILKLNKSFFKPINELMSNEIYKNLVSIEKIKQQIFEIFDIKEIKEEYFYQKILDILKDSDIKKEELIIKLLNIINLYIKQNIILINENEEIKKNAADYFINTISTLELGAPFNFFLNYISCFQIKDMLSKYYQIKENLIKNEKNIIYIVKLLDLQNIYSFRNFNLLNKNGIHPNCSLIKRLFNVYNKTENELLDLYNYVKELIPKNSIPFEFFIKIYEDNKNIMNLNESLIKQFIDNLLKAPGPNNQENYIKFYSFIIKYKLDKYLPHLIGMIS